MGFKTQQKDLVKLVMLGRKCFPQLAIEADYQASAGYMNS